MKDPIARVGNLVGAGEPRKAKKTVAALLCVVVAIATAIVALLLRHADQWVAFYTMDPDVARLAAATLPAPTLLFIDNEAARGAINLGSSGSTPIRPLLHDFFAHDNGSHHLPLAIRVDTDSNKWADQLSRGAAADAIAAAVSHGFVPWAMPPVADEWDSLRASLALLTPL